MSSSIASNPVLYGIYKMANLLSDTTGGIAFGIPMVMGNGMPITFNVADLMRVGALSGGILSNLGNLMSAVGNSASGANILKALNISGLTTVSRGGGTGITTSSGAALSESGAIVGNSDSSAVTGKTMSDAKADANAEVAEASDSSDETKLSDVNSSVMMIYTLLSNVVNGSSSIKVDMGDRSAWTAAINSGFGG